MGVMAEQAVITTRRFMKKDQLRSFEIVEFLQHNQGYH
jgi:hypothetical protein